MTIDPELITSISDALYQRGLRHAYVEPLGKVDLEELARIVVEVIREVGWDGS